MATVKTQLIEGQRRIITKIVSGEKRVSCSCCGGYCSYFDIDVLLYDAEFSGGAPDPPVFLAFDDINLKMNLVDSGVFGDNSDQPAINWSRIEGCWRFLCREVTVSDGQIQSETNKFIGGPTTTGKNLWDDICLPLFGEEQESGTYIYSIEFFGWRLRKKTVQLFDFIPSDTYYEVQKWKITKETT